MIKKLVIKFDQNERVLSWKYYLRYEKVMKEINYVISVEHLEDDNDYTVTVLYDDVHENYIMNKMNEEADENKRRAENLKAFFKAYPDKIMSSLAPAVLGVAPHYAISKLKELQSAKKARV